MNNYCCQIKTISGRWLETFHVDFLEAVNKCVVRHKEGHVQFARVFKYPDMTNSICEMRIIQ